jgi:L-rhamnose mutarotase
MKNISIAFVGMLFIAAILSPNICATANERECTMAEEKITKRVGSLIKVKPEFEERYIILHKHAFPGVLRSISECNIRNYSIFLLDGILFSYFEYTGKDFDADMKLIGNETTKEWWKLTDPMQEPLPTRKQGEWWAEMDQLLSLDKLVKPSPQTQRIGLVAEVVKGKEEDVKNFFKNYPIDLEESINKSGVQNSNFYFKDGKVYLYYEYAGIDIRKDLSDLSKNVQFKNLQDELNKFLVRKENGYWEVMKEVFHTN